MENNEYFSFNFAVLSVIRTWYKKALIRGGGGSFGVSL